MTWARPTTALSGRPAARLLATVTRSGCTPECSMAKNLPVRPNPVWISSAMSRIPCWWQRSRKRRRKSSGAGTKPPSPSTGSMTIAGTRDLDGVPDRLRSRGEEDGLGRALDRSDLAQALRQAEVGLVVHDLERGVRRVLELFPHRLHDARVRVADVHHADAAGEVDVALAAHVPQLRAPRPGGRDGVGAGDAARHVLRAQLGEIGLGRPGAHAAILGAPTNSREAPNSWGEADTIRGLWRGLWRLSNGCGPGARRWSKSWAEGSPTGTSRSRSAARSSCSGWAEPGPRSWVSTGRWSTPPEGAPSSWGSGPRWWPLSPRKAGWSPGSWTGARSRSRRCAGLRRWRAWPPPCAGLMTPRRFQVGSTRGRSW